MYKALLVDDEPLAIEGLMLFIDWEAYGFEICGTCENGEEALRAIAQLKPDVVFTDIRMPIVDGLELIERASEANDYKIHFVVLSGYSDFEFAQRALRSGVSHYLLKPIIPSEASAVMADVRYKLDEERSRSIVRSQEGLKRPEELLHRLIGSESCALEDADVMLVQSLSGQCEEWRAMLLEWSGEDSIGLLVMQLSQRYKHLYVLVQSASTFLLVHGTKSSEETKHLLDELNQLLKTGQYRISVGLGQQQLVEIRKSYWSACECMKNFFFEPTSGESVRYAQEDGGNASVELEDFWRDQGLLEAVEWGDKARLSGELERMKELFRERRVEPAWIVSFIEHLIYRCLLLLKESDIETVDVLRTWEEQVASMNAMYDLENRFDSFNRFAGDVIDKLVKKREEKGRHPLKEAEKYILEHYREPITVKELAERFYMNPSYLGQAFQARYERGILEYVHDLRIEEARRLMEAEPYRKMVDIAESVGYSHYNHFLKEYEKRFRSKPTQFMNMSNPPVVL
ncbi:response regulator [Paenibacillus xylaniclasticus]|uniref:response regulator n=1 Tax=Paenibacillus xylaniclasticus TaxID=588083 RepID=UPI0013DE8E81|nr:MULTISPECIES: response regulator [Paenibacillus]GFN30175.1 DNA-binding response regulator [Paenibacillus curdlanolyticus]